MNDLVKLYEHSEKLSEELVKLPEEWLVNLKTILWGTDIEKSNTLQKQQPHVDLSIISPQQSKKRTKCLTPINQEVDETCELLKTKLNVDNKIQTSFKNEQKPTKTNEELASKGKENLQQEEDDVKLMPPPPPNANSTLIRSKKSSKSKVESNAKEQSVKVKIRRASSNTKIKLEHEQRSSQFAIANLELSESNRDADIDSSLERRQLSDSIVVVPLKQDAIVIDCTTDVDDNSVNNDDVVAQAATSTNKTKEDNKGSNTNEIKCKQISIKIKREKASGDLTEHSVEHNANETEATKDENTNCANAPDTVKATRRTRKKKTVVHVPIKVECFSDGEEMSPVASRTRKGSTIRTQPQLTHHQSSVDKKQSETSGRMTHKTFNSISKHIEGNEQINNLEDEPNASTDKVSSLKSTFEANSALNRETVHTDALKTNTVSTKQGDQNTFVLEDNLNSTVTINNEPAEVMGDATFNVENAQSQEDDAACQPSFETAKDYSQKNYNSLITEDESCILDSQLKLSSASSVTFTKVDSNNLGKLKALPKLNKIPARTNELFNPLIQSPVKKRVEAFENVAANAVADHPSKRIAALKKNNSITTSITPTFGKPVLPTLGRFLTPNQGSTITPNSMIAKKQNSSASKAVSALKSSTVSHFKGGNATAKTLQREKSVEDFRKGLQSLAEDRKKQREQKHLLAAQLRETRERQRAERIAKMAKEREEKRLKRQQEMERQKRELEEIHRKIRLEEAIAAAEAAKLKATKSKAILQQERDLLKKISKQEMLPPPPKIPSKYNFNMLHEDDSTDDESKTSYKRPPPPNWSRSHVRETAILMQQHMPTDIIDSFFSVQPMTLDLRIIFPNIDARYLKRNSSALWSTPPRYSELPKY